MIQRAYSPLILLLLVQSSLSQIQNHSVNYQKCSKDQFEHFRNEQNSREYHLTVAESLADIAVSVQKYFIEYQGEYKYIEL